MSNYRSKNAELIKALLTELVRPKYVINNKSFYRDKSKDKSNGQREDRTRERV